MEIESRGNLHKGSTKVTLDTQDINATLELEAEVVGLPFEGAAAMRCVCSQRCKIVHVAVHYTYIFELLHYFRT